MENLVELTREELRKLDGGLVWWIEAVKAAAAGAALLEADRIFEGIADGWNAAKEDFEN